MHYLVFNRKKRKRTREFVSNTQQHKSLDTQISLYSSSTFTTALAFAAFMAACRNRACF